MQLSPYNFLDVQIKNELEKSIERPYGGPYFCTTTHIFSGNYSGAKTLLEYDKDESLEIKEEINQGITRFEIN